MEDLLGQIAADAETYPADVVRELIFLGDYIDRGPDSRRVVDIILGLKAVPRLWSVTALVGNHEDALLQFLRHAEFWPIWAHYGAAETLLSYGVPPPPLDGGLEVWSTAQKRLQSAIPPDHLQFFNGLTLSATRADYFCVHAGVRPNVRLERQKPWDLITIREPFTTHRRAFEKVVVHGHTACGAVIHPHHIAVDTLAYETGQLSAIKLYGVEQCVIQAGGEA